MSAMPLAERLKDEVLVSDRKAANAKFADMVAAFSSQSPPAWLERKNVRNLLLGLADHSPFLWRIAVNHVDWLDDILTAPPEALMSTTLEALEKSTRALDDESALAELLRNTRAKVALLIALADLGGLWRVAEVTDALSAAADAYVRVTLEFLLRQAVEADRLIAAPDDNLQTICGLVVLALGKHGARELNYSSDVDLVVFYDAKRAQLAPTIEPSTFYVRLTKALAKLLSERTGDGYVLRVDLRLRPDPGSTAVAVSINAALSYYENLGQNWERAAMIKARPIAGDLALGEWFIGELRPFIWRRYFDYAAIADIHAMKRQIHAVRGHSEITIAGHDVKLGRGGIREVEFFVQTQQLIFGGRRVELRGRQTIAMLQALKDDGWVTDEAVQDLTGAYEVLRKVEHRLQMIADEQTQRLPKSDDDLARFARFCGFAKREKFDDWLTAHFRDVERHYARLFEHAPALDAGIGSLVFTGVTDDPETVATLAGLGFKDPPRAIETIRGWHFGRRAAVQTARAREVLTELTPDLIVSLAGSGDPDAALAALDDAMGHMPAAVQLFSILKSNAKLRDLFGDVLGAAPRLAAIIARRPTVLDAVIDPAFFGASFDRAFFDVFLARLNEVEDTEEFFDQCRLLVQEAQFAIGVRLLSGAMGAPDAGEAYSALAESMIAINLRHVERKFEAEYGRIRGGAICVLGFGKLGSREMTASSDLDLVVIYDFDAEHPESDGPRALHAVQYYSRLTQRLVTALTTSTRRGVLYEVDMRLRPSGKKGPLAVQFSSFRDYHRNEAEVWEHMALSRARIVCGGADLAAALAEDIQKILAMPRDADALARSIREMRSLIAQEKGEDDPRDIKTMRGGLIDIEFIAQYLRLRWGAEISAQSAQHPMDVIQRAASAGKLDGELANILSTAYAFYAGVTQLERVIVGPDLSRLGDMPGARAKIAIGVGVPDFARLEAQRAEYGEAVRRAFLEILGG